MAKLEIKNLWVKVADIHILKGVNLTINDHETVALLGPNGHGKSTLLSAIMGHPKYEVTDGEILLDGKNVLEMEVDERSKAGLFLGMQHPSEVPGVINSDFLKAAINVRREKPINLVELYKKLDDASKQMKIPMELSHRHLNEGFSGGERKRNEILQLILLKPSIAMLDEIDSGLDVDALQTVAEAIKRLQKETNSSFLIISHYARLFQMIQPTRVIVMINGRVAVEGGPEVITKIDGSGYEWLTKEYGISIKKEDKDAKPVAMNTISIGACATNEATNHAKK
ncbi:MAG: Fe-S cluster assembly ATPase SufC [Bacilli bacterium]